MKFFKQYKTSIIASLVIVGVAVIPMLVAAAGLVPCDGPGNTGEFGPTRPCDISALGLLIENVIKFVIGLGLILSAITFAWAGIMYLTAGGDPAKIKNAHTIFQKVLVGSIIALSAYVIVDLIFTGLMGEHNDPFINSALEAFGFK